MDEHLTDEQIGELIWNDDQYRDEEERNQNSIVLDVMEEDNEENDEQSCGEDGDEQAMEQQDIIPPEDDIQLGPCVCGKNGYIWSSTVPTKRGRPLARNILIIKPGPKNGAEHVKSPLEIWNLLFNQEMLDLVVLHTNQEIERKSSHYSVNNYSVNSTNVPEIKALIGLYYLGGVLRVSDLNVEDLWSPSYGNGLFRATMSMKRFYFLTDCLRFDDKGTRQMRANDKFTHIRSLWNSFIANCKKLYSPTAHVTIDEQLVSCRVRCPFLMYMPKKPGKYGIKFVMMNDSKTYYMCDAIPYVGQVTDRLPNELVPEYYVRKLSESISGSKRNITCDNWFTTIPVVDRMLETNQLTMVGTLRKNKPEIPQCFFQERAINSTVFGFDKTKTLVSFSPKKNKNVVLVSSMHHDDTIDEETGKPEVIIMYNKNKGGTDTFDKLCATFSTSRKNLRWPMQVFYAMLDQGGVNAYVLFVLANPQWKVNAKHNRRFFLKDLSAALTRDHMIIRSQQSNLPRSLKLQINEILRYKQDNAEEVDNEPVVDGPPDDKQKRCYLCDRKKDRKTKVRCNTCKKPVCKEHSVDTCIDCTE